MRRSSIHRGGSAVRSYGLAILSVAAALPFTIWLTIPPLFFPPILVSAWYGGMGPGLLASVLSVLGNILCLNRPDFALRITSLGNAIYLLVWSLTALSVTWLTAKQREIQEGLRESEARLEESERIAHVGYWENDLDSNSAAWSDETYRILGLSPREGFPNMTEFWERIHPEDRQLHADAKARANRGDSRYNVEYRVVRPDREVRTVHSVGDVVRDASGKPRCLFGVVQDIFRNGSGLKLKRNSFINFFKPLPILWQ